MDSDSIACGKLDPDTKPSKSNIGQKKSKEFNIDYWRLESELQRELEADKKYWIQNEAKIRAVNTVSTYEDFRQIVLAAHLRPLDKSDRESLEPGAEAKKGRVIWNTVARRGLRETDHSSTDCGADPVVLKNLPIVTKLPTTFQEFVREWTNLKNCDSEKLIYLQALLQDNGQLKRLFSFEVPVEILSSILVLFENYVKDLEDARVVLKMLNIIAESRRFSLTQIFLSTDDRKSLAKIFTLITQFVDDSVDILKTSEESEKQLTSDPNLQQVFADTRNLFNTVKAQYRNIIN